MKVEMDLLHTVARHAEAVMGTEGFRYVSAVVANCKMLALELEARDEGSPAIDMDALVIAAYLHDISTLAQGFANHHITSASMAVEFLGQHDVSAECIQRVEQAILAHTTALSPEQRSSVSIEGQILYDADNLGRLSGLAVVTSLIEFGARYPHRSITGDTLIAMLKHIEERLIELFQSLNTAPAREMAQEKFGQTLGFIDGVIEHLSDATPV